MLERMRESGPAASESRDFPGWKAERRGWFTEASREIEENWLLPGGTHLRVVAQPLPDGGVLLIFEDRTEQVALASARDTLLRVRTATFDNLFEAVAVFAADGRLNLWNSRFREVWGLEDSLLDQHPRIDALVAAVSGKLASPTRADRIRDLVRSATIERRQPQRAASPFADGRHLEFAAVPLPDGNALFTLLDITDSRRIESALRERAEALEAADRIKTAFVANMSYELRTPLTSIGGFAEMMAAGYAGKLPRQAKDYTASILEAVARLATLVDDVLALTSGEAPPERQASSEDHRRDQPGARRCRRHGRDGGNAWARSRNQPRRLRRAVARRSAPVAPGGRSSVAQRDHLYADRRAGAARCPPATTTAAIITVSDQRHRYRTRGKGTGIRQLSSRHPRPARWRWRKRLASACCSPGSSSSCMAARSRSSPNRAKARP